MNRWYFSNYRKNPARIMRMICSRTFHSIFLLNVLHIGIFIVLMGFMAVRRLKKRLIL